MIHIGHDIQLIGSVEEATHIWEPDVVFTASEIRYAGSTSHPASTLCGLFCAREALYKALGRSVECYWTDAEVVRGPHNRPEFRFGGALNRLLKDQRLAADLSISHSGDYACAVVVLQPDPGALFTSHQTSQSWQAPRCSTSQRFCQAPQSSIQGNMAASDSNVEQIEFSRVEMTLMVRPNDIDRFGHVNNAVILEYFEAGRRAWLRRNGLEETSILPVVARVGINYRREVPETTLTVVTTLKSRGAYAVVFEQSLLVDGSVAADAEIQVGFVDQVAREVATVEEFFEAVKR